MNYLKRIFHFYFQNKVKLVWKYKEKTFFESVSGLICTLFSSHRHLLVAGWLVGVLLSTRKLN